ncbi:unnamed protein product [Trichogramma brassicae]|uniref:Uncharacterized protein n=1 Tax=Trichogramma brassicae TaxID=86971 RepID=A0A6H5HY43_9HYME|nr:unnamed protein product [Trichogramma brassicae]
MAEGARALDCASYALCAHAFIIDVVVPTVVQRPDSEYDDFVLRVGCPRCAATATHAYADSVDRRREDARRRELERTPRPRREIGISEHPRSSSNSRSRFDIVSLQLRETIRGLDSSHNNNNNNNNDNGSNNFEKRSYGRLQASGSCDSLLIADQQQQQQQEPRARQQCTHSQIIYIVTRIERPYDRSRARGKINIACSAYNWSACAALMHRSKINTPGNSVYSSDRVLSDVSIYYMGIILRGSARIICELVTLASPSPPAHWSTAGGAAKNANNSERRGAARRAQLQDESSSNSRSRAYSRGKRRSAKQYIAISLAAGILWAIGARTEIFQRDEIVARDRVAFLRQDSLPVPREASRQKDDHVAYACGALCTSSSSSLAHAHESVSCMCIGAREETT